MGLGIGEVTQGYSRSGAEAYLSDLNKKAIDETAKLVRDISSIRTAIEAGWQGQAELNFMTNLENAADITAQGLEEMKATLEGQFALIEEAWANQDNQMVEVE